MNSVKKIVTAGASVGAAAFLGGGHSQSQIVVMFDDCNIFEVEASLSPRGSQNGQEIPTGNKEEKPYDPRPECVQQGSTEIVSPKLREAKNFRRNPWQILHGISRQDAHQKVLDKKCAETNTRIAMEQAKDGAERHITAAIDQARRDQQTRDEQAVRDREAKLEADNFADKAKEEAEKETQTNRKGAAEEAAKQIAMESAQREHDEREREKKRTAEAAKAQHERDAAQKQRAHDAQELGKKVEESGLRAKNAIKAAKQDKKIRKSQKDERMADSKLIIKNGKFLAKEGHCAGQEIVIEGDCHVPGSVYKNMDPIHVKGDLIVEGAVYKNCADIKVDGDLVVRGSGGDAFYKHVGTGEQGLYKNKGTITVGKELNVNGDVSKNDEDISAGTGMRVWTSNRRVSGGNVYENTGAITVESGDLKVEGSAGLYGNREAITVKGSLDVLKGEIYGNKKKIAVGKNLSVGGAVYKNIGDIEVDQDCEVKSNTRCTKRQLGWVHKERQGIYSNKGSIFVAGELKVAGTAGVRNNTEMTVGSAQITGDLQTKGFTCDGEVNCKNKRSHDVKEVAGEVEEKVAGENAKKAAEDVEKNPAKKSWSCFPFRRLLGQSSGSPSSPSEASQFPDAPSGPLPPAKASAATTSTSSSDSGSSLSRDSSARSPSSSSSLAVGTGMSVVAPVSNSSTSASSRSRRLPHRGAYAPAPVPLANQTPTTSNNNSKKKSGWSTKTKVIVGVTGGCGGVGLLFLIWLLALA